MGPAAVRGKSVDGAPRAESGPGCAHFDIDINYDACYTPHYRDAVFERGNCNHEIASSGRADE